MPQKNMREGELRRTPRIVWPDYPAGRKNLTLPNIFSGFVQMLTFDDIFRCLPKKS